MFGVVGFSGAGAGVVPPRFPGGAWCPAWRPVVAFVVRRCAGGVAFGAFDPVPTVAARRVAIGERPFW